MAIWSGWPNLSTMSLVGSGRQGVNSRSVPSFDPLSCRACPPIRPAAIAGTARSAGPCPACRPADWPPCRAGPSPWAAWPSLRPASPRAAWRPRCRPFLGHGQRRRQVDADLEGLDRAPVSRDRIADDFNRVAGLGIGIVVHIDGDFGVRGQLDKQLALGLLGRGVDHHLSRLIAEDFAVDLELARRSSSLCRRPAGCAGQPAARRRGGLPPLRPQGWRIGPPMSSRGGIVPGAGVRGSGGVTPGVRSGVLPGVNTVNAPTFSCTSPVFLSTVTMKRT